jgi:hypothetical protein
VVRHEDDYGSHGRNDQDDDDTKHSEFHRLDLLLDVRGDQNNTDSSNQDAERYEDCVQGELCLMPGL